MVYERGTASSTQDLFTKLTSFMATVPGWQLWSNFDGYSTPDKVYYSVGSTGRNAIYIRQRIAPAVPYIVDQVDGYDYGSGDTGYLVFNAYVNFPKDGQKNSGVAEIGMIGPRMVLSSGTDSYRWWHQDFLSQKPGGSSHAVYGTVLGENVPSATYPDYRAISKRRWTETTAGPTEGDIYIGRQYVVASDGLANIYVGTGVGGRLYKYSLKRTCGKTDTFGWGVTGGTLLTTFGNSPKYMVYVEDRVNRIPYLYIWFGSSNINGVRYNLITGSQTSLATFSWPGRGQPVTYTGQGGTRGICWDGKRYIYFTRGDVYQDYVGGGYQISTPDWARYDTLTGIYRTTTVPEDPQFHGIMFDYGGGATGLNGRHQLAYLDKNVSGFSHNRLYLTDGDYISFMDLDEDTGLPSTENPWWTFQSKVTPWDYWTGRIFFTRTKKMFIMPVQSQQINGKYQRFPTGSDQRLLISMDMTEPAAQKNDIRYVDYHYFPEREDSTGSEVWLFDGYASRVRTSIGTNTEYIFIGDEDHITIATKSYPTKGTSGTPTWSMAYMGAFNSSYSNSPYAELAEDLYAGAHRKVALTNIVGNFDTAPTYAIVDTNNEQGFINTYKYADQRTRRVANSELITLFSFDGNSAVISAKNNYKAGAKIGYDPQPVGLFFWELERFQATNVGPRMSDDICGCDDPSKQSYSTMSIDNVLTSAVSQPIITNQPLTIMEYPIMSSDFEGYNIARENRGTMKGVYALGKISGISGGQTVSIGNESYFVLDLPDYNKYLLIGPMTTQS